MPRLSNRNDRLLTDIMNLKIHNYLLFKLLTIFISNVTFVKCRKAVFFIEYINFTGMATPLFSLPQLAPAMVYQKH